MKNYDLQRTGDHSISETLFILTASFFAIYPHNCGRPGWAGAVPSEPVRAEDGGCRGSKSYVPTQCTNRQLRQCRCAEPAHLHTWPGRICIPGPARLHTWPGRLRIPGPPTSAHLARLHTWPICVCIPDQPICTPGPAAHLVRPHTWPGRIHIPGPPTSAHLAHLNTWPTHTSDPSTHLAQLHSHTWSAPHPHIWSSLSTHLARLHTSALLPVPACC